MHAIRRRRLGYTIEVILGCWLLLWTSFAIGQSTADELADNSSFIHWAQNHAMPLQATHNTIDDKDLYPVKKMIGDARLVA